MNETRGLWRGKRVDEKKWAYGYLISPEVDGKVAYIGYLVATDDHGMIIAPVDLSTLGEFTGLRDKNGKLIFEGDMVKIRGKIGRALFVDDEAGFIIDTDETYFTMSYSSECEVMGNIHDNPELLKGENDVP